MKVFMRSFECEEQSLKQEYGDYFLQSYKTYTDRNFIVRKFYWRTDK